MYKWNCSNKKKKKTKTKTVFLNMHLCSNEGITHNNKHVILCINFLHTKDHIFLAYTITYLHQHPTTQLKIYKIMILNIDLKKQLLQLQT